MPSAAATNDPEPAWFCVITEVITQIANGSRKQSATAIATAWLATDISTLRYGNGPAGFAPARARARASSVVIGRRPRSRPSASNPG